ncbi:MAG TPA: maleylpyruvate isomerase N-terminal domain-containing protein [Actinotalea sp.]
MITGWSGSRQAFADAAGWFVTVARKVDDRWADPGLGEWDVRALVGHTSRSLLTVEAYLQVPAERVDVESPAAYYVASRAVASGPGVAQRGRDAGAALGADPAAAVAEIAARVLPLVDSRDGSELLTSVAGGMRLADYLPTRTFELVVHTLDLAAALGLAEEPPPLPARAALGLLAELAVADGLAGPLLLAATGRTSLPPGFSVL